MCNIIINTVDDVITDSQRMKLGILLKVREWADEKLTTKEKHNKLLLAADHDVITAFFQGQHIMGNYIYCCKYGIELKRK